MVFETLTARLLLDASDFHEGTAQAEDDMGGLSGTMQKTGDRMKSLGARMTLGVSAPMAMIGAKAIQTASDVNEMQNRLSVLFGKSTNDIKSWAKAQEKATGITELSYQNFAGSVMGTFTSMGFAKKQATDMSKRVSQLAVDLASFNNLDPTESLDALKSGLIGNHDALDKFGVAINQTSLDQELLKEGFKTSAQGATEQQKMMARLNLVMQATKAAQGDAARTSGSFANQMRALKGQLKEAAATIGKALLPTATSLLHIIKPIVTQFASLNPRVIRFITILGGVAAALGPVIGLLGILMTTPISVPLLAGAAAFSAIAAGAVAFSDKLAPLANQSMKLATSIRSSLAPTIDYLRAQFAKVESVAQEAASILGDALVVRMQMTMASWRRIWAQFSPPLIAARNTVAAFVAGVSKIFKSDLVMAVQDAFFGIVALIKGDTDQAKRMFGYFVQELVVIAGLAKQQLSAAWSKAVKVLPTLLTNAVNKIITSLPGQLDYAISIVVTKGQQLITRLSPALGKSYGNSISVLKTKTDTIVSKVGTSWQNLKPKILGAINPLLTPLQSFAQKMGYLDKQGRPTVALLTKVALKIAALTNPVAAVVSGLLTLHDAWKANLFGIRDITNQAFTVIKSTFNSSLVQIRKTWNTQIAPLVAQARQNFNQIKAVVTSAVTFLLTNVIRPVWNSIQQVWAIHGQAIMTETRKTWNAIKSMISGVVTHSHPSSRLHLTRSVRSSTRR